MKILLVGTLKRKVAADEFSSRSRIIFELASGLAKKGHQLTLLGTADSIIPGVTLIPVIEKGWVDLPLVENPYFREIATLIQITKKIVAIQKDFDMIHNHLFPEFFTPIIENELHIPMLTTLHSQATGYIDKTLSLFPKSYFAAISKSQKKMFKKSQILTVVYNGIDTKAFSLNEKKEDYLLWIGRITKEKNEEGNYLDPKGVSHAIALAQKTNQRLLLSGTVHDTLAFKQLVAPFLNDKIQWVGNIQKESTLSQKEVVNLMQKAKVFLMTINWEEPFGLTMVEAMSCGTPVIAFDRGSVKEIIIDGETGFVVDPKDGTSGLENALFLLPEIAPKNCRARVEKYFSIDIMVDNYEKVYKSLVTKR